MGKCKFCSLGALVTHSITGIEFTKELQYYQCIAGIESECFIPLKEVTLKIDGDEAGKIVVPVSMSDEDAVDHIIYNDAELLKSYSMNHFAGCDFETITKEVK